MIAASYSTSTKPQDREVISFGEFLELDEEAIWKGIREQQRMRDREVLDEYEDDDDFDDEFEDEFEEAFQDPDELERMQSAIEESWNRSVAEKAQIQSAVEKARLQRQATQANATKGTTIAKGIAITRGATKVVATRSITPKGLLIKRLPIKGAPAKSILTKLNAAREAAVKQAIDKGVAIKEDTTKPTTNNETIAKQAFVEEAIVIDTTAKSATTKPALIEAVTAEKTTAERVSTAKAVAQGVTTIADAATTKSNTVATKARVSKSVRVDSPVRTTSKPATTEINHQVSIKSKRSRTSPRERSTPATEPRSILLPELSESTRPPDSLLAKRKPKRTKPALESYPPLGEEYYSHLKTASLSQERLETIKWMKSLSKAQRNESIQKSLGHGVEYPYSRELYNDVERRNRDPILKRRCEAVRQLRWIMGHGTSKKYRRDFWDWLPNRLGETDMKDVRLICIDTDRVRRQPIRPGEWKRRISSFHIGIAILDTKDIRDVMTRGINLPRPADLIKTYEFAVQTQPPEDDTFIFGNTESISLESLKQKFIEWQSGHDVIGVAYSVRNDLILLKDFNIYLNQAFWMDVAQATYPILKTTWAPKLAILLESLNIQYAKLHSAGNDAHFTMRAMLGLAVLDVIHELDYGGTHQPWCNLATSIARSPLPEHERAALREWGRQIEERKTATTNWHRKSSLSQVPLPHV
ncbi:uncharacterized protein B0J16DRAFT_380565 [Fusarium flagelliforme]|uniref:3-5 exonuclease superfamily protein n=1 Tax=Fusarium flagelliforme TaxID=2675880 RepID=A0A395MXT7_9HYPO|nr:uncharacterized protein B0J16DRAFT_380565 [Fusarium flagelliforme]KAH7192679.1 hypothetical protein B0J16DRAFT_380565 [Fusarium flagelliforme]RFN52520.1 3-5 exonuclease superfamily protein [Fusarium flagelliforme]